MKYKYCVILLLAVFVLPVALWAGEPLVKEIRIIDYGLFEEISVKDSRPTTQGENIIDNTFVEVETQHKQTTDIIKPEIGVEFGILFKIIGEPLEKEVEIEVIHEHPSIYSPDKKIPITKQNYFTKKKIGDTNHALMLISEKWEIVHGEWKITIKHKDKKYLEKVFKLTE